MTAQNPFLTIAQTDPHAARILALAFVVSHGNAEDVFAALRMAQRLDFREPSPVSYLFSSLFAGWLADDASAADIEFIRDELAHPFLDGLAESRAS